MFKQLFSSLAECGLLSMPVMVMLFFLATFCVVVCVALSRTRRDHYDAMSRLPLETGEDDHLATEVK